MSVPKRLVSITTLLGLSVTSQVSKSTFVGSTERKSGSARSAQSDMLCNPTGKLTLKPVAPGNTNVTVEQYFHGNVLLLLH